MYTAPPPNYDLMPAHVAKIARVTGQPLPGETLPNPNQTDRNYHIYGTDLGILWQSGPHELMVVFGDTYGEHWGGDGAGPETADWRSNVLALAANTDPARGLVFSTMIQDAPGHAKEIIACKKEPPEITLIPTAGVTVGTRHYLYYMSVRHWGAPGVWETNFSSLAYSDDHGHTWTKSSETIWSSDAPGQDHFQQVAVARQGDEVYLFGTPSGRYGDVYLARVGCHSLLDKAAYEYWDGQTWQRNHEAVAMPVIAGPVAEMSVAYNTHFHRWILIYLSERKNVIILRDAPALTGPWTDEKTLVSRADYPGLYGGFLDSSHMDGPDLYFTLSQWQPYNVFWMHATLEINSSLKQPTTL